ncbi:MAG: BON domain-containing protein, partial [Terriglobia bacterium]
MKMSRARGMYGLFVAVVLALAVGACSKISSSPDDPEIVSAIEAKLYQSPELKSLSVGVSSNHGVVTLTGTVTAPLEKLAVEDVALKASGVKQVVDQLQVAEAKAVQPTQAQSPAAPVSSATPAEEAQAHPHRQPKRRRIAQNTDPQSQPETNEDNNPAAPTAEPTQTAQTAQTAPPAPPAEDAPPPLPPVQVTIPSGTTISVRLIDSISSANAQAGQVYAASLLAPVVANGSVMIPKGADAKVRVVEVKSAGHYKGQSELQLTLASLSSNGADYPLQTGYYTKEGTSRSKNTAEKVGGGAALGTLLGAVIGHGKGA